MYICIYTCIQVAASHLFHYLKSVEGPRAHKIGKVFFKEGCKVALRRRFTCFQGCFKAGFRNCFLDLGCFLLGGANRITERMRNHNIFLNMYMYIGMYIRTYIYICIYTMYPYWHIFRHIYIYIYMCVCVFLYICIHPCIVAVMQIFLQIPRYPHTFIHIYIYIHITVDAYIYIVCILIQFPICSSIFLYVPA